jgi:D-sedoheptulose 7-phosphate isomerase
MDKSIKEKITEIIDEHKKKLAELEAHGLETIIVAAEAITTALKQGRRIYVCGNGGSAADAQHIAGELVGRFERERKALAAVALTTDTSVITSVANDFGYETIFTRQVEALVQKGDIFWAISTSGSSANVVAAAELAKQKGALVLAFTGKANSKLQKTTDICLCIEASTPRNQEVGQLAYHIICDLIEQKMTGN